MNAVSVPVSCAGEKNLEIRHSDVTVELRVATKLKILMTVEGSAESMQANISYDIVSIISNDLKCNHKCMCRRLDVELALPTNST